MVISIAVLEEALGSGSGWLETSLGGANAAFSIGTVREELPEQSEQSSEASSAVGEGHRGGGGILLVAAFKLEVLAWEIRLNIKVKLRGSSQKLCDLCQV